MLNKIYVFGFVVCFFSGLGGSVFAAEQHMANSHAPIGVMGDHRHKQGEWMLSYRYGRMEMDGNRDGSSNRSRTEVFQKGFMVSPLDMTMEMHMFGVMYAPTDKLTLMSMVPYKKIEMTHITSPMMMMAPNRKFTTRSEGVGDVKVSGLYQLYESPKHLVHANVGVSLPTGSIEEKDKNAMGVEVKLPYPMQLGSGTVDPLLGLTYVNRYSGWSWGGQANAVLRFGDNDQGYRLGNEYGLTSWVDRNIVPGVSISARLDGKSWRDIRGDDNDLNPSMVPTARTDLRGGKRVDALVGVNLLKGHGALSGNRLAIEFGKPVYQSLDGPQLKTDYRLMIGWQLAL